MNTERRNRVQALIDELQDKLAEAESIQDEEQEAYDNMPESLRSSDRDVHIEEDIDFLEYAATYIQAAIDNLQSILD